MTTNKNELLDILSSFYAKAINKSVGDIFRDIHVMDQLYNGIKYYDTHVNVMINMIAAKKSSIALLRYVVKRLSSVKDKQNEDYFQLGSAHMLTAEIKYDKTKSLSYLIKDEDLLKARLSFEKVAGNRSPALTNIGNIFGFLGRIYEAFMCYDEVLVNDPHFGMALGNKAESLIFYFRGAKRKNPDILFAAKALLEEALMSNNVTEHGGEETLARYKQEYEEIKELLKYDEFEPLHFVEIDDYQSYCSKRNLYLNYCFNCYRCSEGYKDLIAPSLVAKVDDSDIIDDKYTINHSSRIYYSISMLNQILEDYVTSRHIYFSSLDQDYRKRDQETQFIYLSDECYNSIKYGLTKTSYIKLFNILDKIAHLVFYYYGLEAQDLSFKSFLLPVYENLIIEKDNRSLLALHSLSKDFEKGGIYHYLKIIRNYLTHRLVLIPADKDRKKNILIEKYQISEAKLDDSLNRLFQIVKAAMLYFDKAVAIDIAKETRGGGGDRKSYSLPLQARHK